MLRSRATFIYTIWWFLQARKNLQTGREILIKFPLIKNLIKTRFDLLIHSGHILIQQMAERYAWYDLQTIIYMIRTKSVPNENLTYTNNRKSVCFSVFNLLCLRKNRNRCRHREEIKFLKKTVPPTLTIQMINSNWQPLNWQVKLT